MAYQREINFNNHIHVLYCWPFFFSELKDGRVPISLTNNLGYWKAEEYQKFSFPSSEVILSNVLEPDNYHLWQLTCRMTELVFNKRDGWSHEHAQLFHVLAKRYLILLEEGKGIKACTITTHNLLHVHEDAMRFSHPDNYWCFNFERTVPSLRGNLAEKFLKLSVLMLNPPPQNIDEPSKINLEKVSCI